MLLFFDISIGFVQYFQRKKLSKNSQNYFFQISSKMIILEILLDKIEILVQFTYFQAYFHQYVSYKISFRFWSRICLKWLFLVIFRPKFRLPLQQQLLLLGYHNVATLKMCYPKIKINYDTNVLREIPANIYCVAFLTFPTILYCNFKAKINDSKNQFSNFFKKCFSKICSERSWDIDQIQRIFSLETSQDQSLSMIIGPRVILLWDQKSTM